MSFSLHPGKRDLKWTSHLHGEGQHNQKTITDAKMINELNKSMVAGYPNQQVMRIVPDQPAIVPSFGYTTRQFAEGRGGIGAKMLQAKRRQEQVQAQNASNFSKDSNNSSNLIKSFQDLLIPKNISPPENNFKTNKYSQRREAMGAFLKSL